MYIKSLAMIFFSHIIFANSSGPPKAKANNAPLNQNCTGCHNGTVNSGNGEITIENLPNNYIPKKQYDLILKVLKENSGGYGFQLAVQAGNNSAGRFLLGNNIELNGNYLQHSRRTASGKWIFSWIAPDLDVGDIKFSASVLAANSNGNNSGDKTYTMSKVLKIADCDHSFSYIDIDNDCFDDNSFKEGSKSGDVNLDGALNVMDLLESIKKILNMQ